MSENENIKTATPVYTLINIDAIPVNPYREFSYYAARVVYPTIENKVNLSFKEFFNLPQNEQVSILKQAESFAKDAKIEILENPIHKRVFLEGNYYAGNTILCNFKFYSHLAYAISENESPDIEHYAAELDFTNNKFLDFLNIDTADNFFDFSKDDTNSMSVDMVLAFLKTFTNSTEFIKVFKAKSLVNKNIQLFANKLVRPYVVDMNIIFTPEHFLIGAICGNDIIKESYTFDNYLENIKKFAASIRLKYGDKYKHDSE